MLKCEQLLHLHGEYIDTAYTNLSTFILENFRIQKTGHTLPALVCVFWLCSWLLLFTLLSLSLAPWAVYSLWVGNVFP